LTEQFAKGEKGAIMESYDEGAEIKRPIREGGRSGL